MGNDLVCTVELPKLRSCDAWRGQWVPAASHLKLWRVHSERAAASYLLQAVDHEGADQITLNLHIGSSYAIHRSGFSSVKQLSEYYWRQGRREAVMESVAPLASTFTGIKDHGKGVLSLAFKRLALEGEKVAGGTKVELVRLGSHCLDRIFAPLLRQQVLETSATDAQIATDAGVLNPRKRSAVPISATSNNKNAVKRLKWRTQNSERNELKSQGIGAISRGDVSVGDMIEKPLDGSPHLVSCTWPADCVPAAFKHCFINKAGTAPINYWHCRHCGSWDARIYERHKKCKEPNPAPRSSACCDVPAHTLPSCSRDNVGDMSICPNECAASNARLQAGSNCLVAVGQVCAGMQGNVAN